MIRDHNRKDYDAMLAEANEIQDYIETPENLRDPGSLVARLSAINIYIARTGRLLSDARRLKDSAEEAFMTENRELMEKVNSTTFGRLLSADISEYDYLVKRIDRLNAALTHISANLRTEISWMKEEMGLTRSGY